MRILIFILLATCFMACRSMMIFLIFRPAEGRQSFLFRFCASAGMNMN
jgi:hypothetical protein